MSNVKQYRDRDLSTHVIHNQLQDVLNMFEYYKRRGKLDKINQLLRHEEEQYTALVWAITQHHHDMVKLLLSYGAAIKQPNDENNWNALHYAVAWDNTDIIRTLFQHVHALEHRIQLLEQQDKHTGETPRDMLDIQPRKYTYQKTLLF